MNSLSASSSATISHFVPTRLSLTKAAWYRAGYSEIVRVVEISCTGLRFKGEGTRMDQSVGAPASKGAKGSIMLQG